MNNNLSFETSDNCDGEFYIDVKQIIILTGEHYNVF